MKWRCVSPARSRVCSRCTSMMQGTCRQVRKHMQWWESRVQGSVDIEMSAVHTVPADQSELPLRYAWSGDSDWLAGSDTLRGIPRVSLSSWGGQGPGNVVQCPSPKQVREEFFKTEEYLQNTTHVFCLLIFKLFSLFNYTVTSCFYTTSQTKLFLIVLPVLLQNSITSEINGHSTPLTSYLFLWLHKKCTSTRSSAISLCILSMSSSTLRSISGLALCRTDCDKLTFRVWAFCCSVL